MPRVASNRMRAGRHKKCLTPTESGMREVIEGLRRVGADQG